MDEDLAALVATDLRQNLEARAPTVRDVYGFCLWSDDVYGSFLASFATEEEFERKRRLPAYASAPDRDLFAADGLRWSVGDWHKFPDDDFVTDRSQAALAPLVSRMTDDTLPEAELDAAFARWRELTLRVFELARPLELLPCTDDAIGFVGFGDSSVEEQLEWMTRTVPVSRLQGMFPEPPGSGRLPW
jgi:hypothetical protein